MNNVNLDWQPIDTLEYDVYVDLYIFSVINPDFGLRLCNVSKSKTHSFGWTGVNRYDERFFNPEYYKITHWKVITNPENINCTNIENNLTN